MTKVELMKVLGRCENVDEKIGAIGALVVTGAIDINEVLRALLEAYEEDVTDWDLLDGSDDEEEDYEDWDDDDEDDVEEDDIDHELMYLCGLLGC